MTFYNVEQNTEEWMKLRLGKFTSSTFCDIMGKDSTVGYKNAILKVVYERITGEIPEEYTNGWMERGKELEPQAKAWYEFNFTEVSNGGFFCDDWIGASPDAVVGDGLLEIKCPKYSTHMQYLIDNTLPAKYKWQVQGQLFIAEKEYCDFLSYHPKLRPMCLRIGRNEKQIKELKLKLEEAINEAQKTIEVIKNGL